MEIELKTCTTGARRMSVGVVLRVEHGRLYAARDERRSVMAEHELPLKTGLELARLLGVEAEVTEELREQALAIAEQGRLCRVSANDAHHQSMERAGRLDAEAARLIAALGGVAP